MKDYIHKEIRTLLGGLDKGGDLESLRLVPQPEGVVPGGGRGLGQQETFRTSRAACAPSRTLSRPDPATDLTPLET